MKQISLIFLTLFFCIFPSVALAEDNMNFSHINTSNSGLSYDGIRCMLRDSRGYVWIGTQKGLSRYDGTRFRVYNRKELGVDSDYVNSLSEDMNGNILIGTDRGIVLYDHLSDRMRYVEGLSCRVYSMCPSRDGKIYLGVKAEGLYVYDPFSISIDKVSVVNEDGAMLRDIYRLVTCGDKMYVAAYCDNLYQFSLPDLQADEPVRGAVIASCFASDDVEGLAICPMNSSLIYVLSQENGLAEVNRHTGDVRILAELEENVFPTSLACNGDKVWITSTHGLYIYDVSDGHLRSFLNISEDRYSLSDNFTTSLMVTDEGRTVYVGTSGGGVNIYNSDSGDFRKYYLMDGASLEGCNVRCIVEDSSGRIWFGTENAGLLYCDPGSREVRLYAPAEALGTIKSLLFDAGRLWVGTNNGLWLLDLRTGRAVQPDFFDDDSPLSNRRILDIFKASDGTMYVGTAIGAYILDLSRKQVLKIEDTGIDAIEDVTEDHYGTIWMATYSNGVYSYDRYAEPSLKHYCSKNDDTPVPEMTSSLSVDSKGNLWIIGFSSGLLRRDAATGEFTLFNRENTPDLPTDLFYSCIQDHIGNMWLNSDAGLVMFNPDNQSVKVYTESYGILEDSMRSGSFRLSTEELAFGFNSGAMIFNPDKVLNAERVFPPVINDLYVHGKVVRPLDKTEILSTNIDNSSKITLSSQQRSVSFDFSVPWAGSSARYDLRCMLEGYDEEWQNISVTKSVSYHNLPAGTYCLHIAASTNQDEIRHNPLIIEVKPHFFSSAAGIAVILLCLCLLMMIIIMVIRRIEKKRAEREREEYEKIREEQILSEKMEMLSNVANEIKTPLTIIKTPLNNLSELEELKKNGDFESVISSVDMLDRMTGDIQDFIRAEENVYILQKRNIDIVEKVGFVCMNFKEILSDRSIAIKFTPSEKKLMIFADSKVIGRILTSVMNYISGYAMNAVDVSLRREGVNLHLEVNYDTYPVSEKHEDYVFKPFSQYASTRSTGIGLSYARTLANIHGGNLNFELDASRTKATFHLELPIEPLRESETAVREETFVNSSLPLLLLVEGNVKLLSYMKRHLKQYYNMIVSSSAEEAMQLLITWNVDLILSDLALPGMNGMEFCSKIRSSDSISYIPFILIASSMSPDIKLTCMKKGADLCVEMPFSMDYLKVCIDNILDNRVRVKSHVVQNRKNITERPINIVDRDEVFLEKLDALIVENISNPGFSVKDMEQILGFSRSSFNRKVNALLSMSPNEYLRHRRLTYAAQMLGRKNCRVSDVCYKVGFNSPSYFAKCFKEKFGVLPADYSQ
ncbi:MAG: helix-turn-helix domain-containing protein [Bacteroidales bacterium]|nr:helix-turn-helix domain-containing protein [Bacteroidales bacterium]